METFVDLWSSYAVCYAIGYMLLIRPRLNGNKLWDRVFYSSLLVASTITFIY